MKLIAAAMITAACSLLGFYAASRAAYRLRTLEKIVIMISEIRTRLEFVCLPVDDLLEILLDDSRLESLPFLGACVDARRRNEPFPSAWEKAVSACAQGCCLPEQDSKRLTEFGKSLGATDLRGQIACCELYISLFEARVSQCAQAREKFSKTLPPLGVLGGLALSILIV